MLRRQAQAPGRPDVAAAVAMALLACDRSTVAIDAVGAAGVWLTLAGGDSFGRFSPLARTGAGVFTSSLTGAATAAKTHVDGGLVDQSTKVTASTTSRGSVTYRLGMLAADGSCNSYGGQRPRPTYLAGQLDEAAVWRRELSAAEVLTNYRRGANRLKSQGLPFTTLTSLTTTWGTGGCAAQVSYTLSADGASRWCSNGAGWAGSTNAAAPATSARVADAGGHGHLRPLTGHPGTA